MGETSEGTKGASSGFPTTQAGLGVLSAAGLLAFVGLRRVSKAMATNQTD